MILLTNIYGFILNNIQVVQKKYAIQTHSLVAELGTLTSKSIFLKKYRLLGKIRYVKDFIGF